MKNIIALLFIISSFCAKGQDFKTEAITGSWKVVRVINGNNNKDVSAFSNSFLHSTFQFNKNGSFIFSPIKLNNGMSAFSAMFKKSSWIFNEAAGIINVGTKADKYSLMRIKVDKNIKHFIFDETDLMLEVIKI